MQYVQINGKKFSRIVCGTNAFYGRSHFSEARDVEYADRCSDDYIKQIIRKCLKYGVNGVETSANERIARIISELRQKEKTDIHFIGSTRIDKTSPMKTYREKLDFLIEHKAEVCVIHAQLVDRPRKSREIKGLGKLIDRIHGEGLIAAISTHHVSTVEICEEQDYGVDLYLFPLNETGFVYPGFESKDTVEDRIKLIQSIPKPFMLMKVLGAGRISPLEGLQFALDNCKNNDLITLGLSSVEETEESLDMLAGLMAR